jgi:hypothetical protein
MKPVSFAFAAVLLAGPALAQTSSPPAPAPGINSSTGARSDAGVVERNQGPAAASGDRNQAVTTTDANAGRPARGSNSFTEGQARGRLEDNGFQSVTSLKKDDDGIWRGVATKGGTQGPVWLDYKGNAGQGNTPPQPDTASNDTTTGQSVDRSLGTNMTGTNPAANRPDGTPGNPPGTAAGRAIDRTLDTNVSGANPGGGNAAR